MNGEFIATKYKAHSMRHRLSEASEDHKVKQNIDALEMLNVIAGAATITKVLIFMIGPPGSGKSTTAKWLRKKLEARGWPTSVHSTDSFFEQSGYYKFDSAYLDINHRKNLMQSIASQAHIIIIDNTNLEWTHRSNYLDSHRDKIPVKLKMKKCEVQFLRNTHCVPQRTLERMVENHYRTHHEAITKFFNLSNLKNYPQQWGELSHTIGFVDLCTYQDEYIQLLGRESEIDVVGYIQIEWADKTSSRALVSRDNEGFECWTLWDHTLDWSEVDIEQHLIACEPYRLALVLLPCENEILFRSKISVPTVVAKRKRRCASEITKTKKRK